MREVGEDLYTTACEEGYPAEERVIIFLTGLQLALTACAEARLSGLRDPLEIAIHLAGVRGAGIEQIVPATPFTGLEAAIAALGAVTDFVDASIPTRPLSDHVATPIFLQ